MDDKKRAITLSAINVFQKKGIEKATVAEIVKGANIAQGTFYLYFPSKLSVMSGIAEILVEKTLQLFQKRFQSSVSFSAQLREIINIIFDYTEEYHDIYAMLYAGMGSNKQLNQWETIYEPYYELVEDIIKQGQEKGEIIQTIEAKRLAIMLIGFIESAADQTFLFDQANSEKIQRKKEDLLLVLSHGFRPTHE